MNSFSITFVKMSTPTTYTDVRVVDGTTGVLKRLLFFSIMILTVPILLYFFFKAYVFEAMFSMSSRDSYFYSAIIAILVIHIVLGMFIYVAWTEDSRIAQKSD